MCDEVQMFYLKWETNQNFAKQLLQITKRIKLLHKIFLVSVTVTFFFPFIAQFLIYLIQGKHILVCYIWLPFTNPDENTGFWINAIVSFLCFPVFYYACTGGFSMSIPLSMHTIAISSVIMMKIDDFNSKFQEYCDEFQEPEKAGKVLEKLESSSRAILNTIYNESNMKGDFLSELIQDMIAYEDYKKIFLTYLRFTTFNELYVSSTGLGFSIAYAYFISVPIGTSWMFIFLFQLVCNCLIGAMIQNQNENILDKLLDFPWMELSLRKKKTFLQFIHVCQHTSDLNVIFFGSINKEVFTDVVNAGYKFFNFLINFIE
jgi:uncharacterized membrane protein